MEKVSFFFFAAVKKYHSIWGCKYWAAERPHTATSQVKDKWKWNVLLYLFFFFFFSSLSSFASRTDIIFDYTFYEIFYSEFSVSIKVKVYQAEYCSNKSLLWFTHTHTHTHIHTHTHTYIYIYIFTKFLRHKQKVRF